MYEFYLGSVPRNFDEESQYLLSVKRLLPRWINSVPDMQFLAICRLLHDLGTQTDKQKERLCLVETGTGATSIALAYYAMKHKGLAFTWDFNTKKGSEIRSACVETFGNLFSQSLNSYWRLIGYHSLSPHLGLPVIQEWSPVVHFSYHDSEHTWKNLGQELESIDPFLRDGSIVSIDDAYYEFLHTDEAYLNVMRRKLALPAVPQLENNRSLPHYQEFENLLRARWEDMTFVGEAYRVACRDDLSIAYFSNELQVRSDLGMDKVRQLETRFSAWQVARRKEGAGR